MTNLDRVIDDVLRQMVVMRSEHIARELVRAKFEHVHDYGSSGRCACGFHRQPARATT